MSNINMKTILDALTKNFSQGEVKTLLFDNSDVFPDWDNLGGNNSKDAKIRELVTYCQRHRRLNILWDYVATNRPFLGWQLSDGSDPEVPPVVEQSTPVNDTSLANLLTQLEENQMQGQVLLAKIKVALAVQA